MMVTLSQVCGCVKRLHPDLRQRVKDDTFLKYQKAFGAFTDYLQRQYDLVLTSPEDLDLLLMEFRTEADLTRAQHVLLVASAEFFLPHVKGKLVVCREALKGRATAEPVKHTVPLTWDCALLFAAWHASEGRPRLGAALLIQHATGLRPSELLALQPGHVHLPLDRTQALTVRLGATYSTKVKREQYVLVDPSSQSLGFSLLARLCHVTPVGQRLFPFGYQTYNASFKLAEAHYDLTLGTTAHSARAGFATHLVLQGCSRKEVQARGRWLSESSFNTYIDVSGASHIAAQVGSQKLATTAKWIESHIWRYFDLANPAHGDSKEKCIGGSFGQQARFSVEVGTRPSTTSTKALHCSPEASVETGSLAGALRRSSRPGSGSVASTAFASSKGKGKGRGILRKRGDTHSSIFD